MELKYIFPCKISAYNSQNARLREGRTIVKNRVVLSALILSAVVILGGAGNNGGIPPAGNSGKYASLPAGQDAGAGREDLEQIPDEEAALHKIPMVMVKGRLYYDTGKESILDRRCGTPDGEITSAVDGSEIPSENNQSNFGTGFAYQYGTDNTIEVLIKDKWTVFEQQTVHSTLAELSEKSESGGTADLDTDAKEESEKICGYPTAEDMQG